MSIQEHLLDIDFRKKEVRQAHRLEDFVRWYGDLVYYTERHDYDPVIQGQLTMLSSVLWYLLPTKDYKKLVTNKKR